MRKIVKGNGKVHHEIDHGLTACNRELEGFTVSTGVVDCKACERKIGVTERVPVSLIKAPRVQPLTGRARHGMIRHARGLRRAAMKARLRSE